MAQAPPISLWGYDPHRPIARYISFFFLLMLALAFVTAVDISEVLVVFLLARQALIQEAQVIGEEV